MKPCKARITWAGVHGCRLPLPGEWGGGKARPLQVWAVVCVPVCKEGGPWTVTCGHWVWPVCVEGRGVHLQS